MKEIWKDIAGYEGRYQVSTLGRVRNSKTGKVLKPHECGGVGGNSYYNVALYQGNHASRKHHLVHRLVADAFIPNPDNLSEVNHIDGNGFNNCVTNLEWISHKDNMWHARYVIGKKVACWDTFAKPVIRVEDGKVFNSIAEATKACGHTNSTSISHCVTGKRKTAYGYHWEYVSVATRQRPNKQPSA